MAIYLPGTAEEEQVTLDELTPREIVAELNKYVVGQNDAKRAVAIALRNRMRRQKLAPEMAELNAEERLLDILLPPTSPRATDSGASASSGGVVIEASTNLSESSSRTREKLRQQLRAGKLDDRTVEIETRERNFPSFEIISNQGVEEMDVNIKDMLPNIFGQRTKKRKMKVN